MSRSGADDKIGPAVARLDLQSNLDEQGSLYSIDFSILPFQPERLFFIQPSDAGVTRGGHAHRTAHQLLVCVSGCIKVKVIYSGCEETISLDRPGLALYLTPLVWSEQAYASAGSKLLVLSSEHYDPASYIRDLNEL